MRSFWTSGLIAFALLVSCSSDVPSTADNTAPTSTTAAVTTVPDSTLPDTTTPDTTLPESTTPDTTAPLPDTDPPAGPLTVQELLDLGRPIVLAHAAGENAYPHSSPYGYAESAAAGVDMLDLDVQLTGDGVLVVQHDETTGRTADQDLVVAESTYAELHALDNAYWFTPDCTCTDQPAAAYSWRGVRTGAVAPPEGYEPDDFAITAFRDIAGRFADFPVNIEIKGTGAPAIAAASVLADELAALDLLDNAVVASFDDAVVEAFHGFAPTVEVTPGLGAASAFILEGIPLPDGQRILQVPVDYGDIHVLTPETIAASHAAGYVIWVWPNDIIWENPDGYADLLAMGLDGLNINVPIEGVAAVVAFAG